MPSSTKLQAQLITAPQAAELLNVNVRTVHNWIEKDAIPYIKLPGDGPRASYRIPLQGLLGSLEGTHAHDLAEEAEALLAAGTAV